MRCQGLIDNANRAGLQLDMAKHSKNTQIAIRFDEKARRELEKEADAAKRKLSDYLRYLIETHPERKKGSG